jgi:hypothetical protein
MNWSERQSIRHRTFNHICDQLDVRDGLFILSHRLSTVRTRDGTIWETLRVAEDFFNLGSSRRSAADDAATAAAARTVQSVARNSRTIIEQITLVYCIIFRKRRRSSFNRKLLPNRCKNSNRLLKKWISYVDIRRFGQWVAHPRVQVVADDDVHL